MSPGPFSFDDLRKAVLGDNDAKARCMEWVGPATSGDRSGMLTHDGLVFTSRACANCMHENPPSRESTKCVRCGHTMPDLDAPSDVHRDFGSFHRATEEPPST